MGNKQKSRKSFTIKAVAVISAVTSTAFLWANVYAANIAYRINAMNKNPYSISQTNGKKKDDKDKRFTFHIGQSIAWSKLNQTNDTIRDLGDMARQYAPGLKTLQDWDDVNKGLTSVGVTYEIPDFPYKGTSVFIDFSMGYAKGNVETNDTTKSIYGTPVSFHHKQTYETTVAILQAGILKEILRYNKVKFDVGIAGELQENFLKSNTELNLEDKMAGVSHTGTSTSDDHELGANLALILKSVINDRWVVDLQFQYIWARVTGNADVTETMTNPVTGKTVSHYQQPYISDFTGPDIYLEVGFKF